MKYSSIILLIFSFLSRSAYAQVDVNQLVHDGENDFISKNYQVAFDKMNEAEKSLDKLTRSNKRKVYFYRAKSLLLIYADEATKKDTASMFQHRNAILEAYADYKRCLSYDTLGIWASRIQDEYSILYPVMFETAYTLAEEQFHAKAIEYFDACIEIVNDNYVIYDLRSQSKLALKDSSGALDDLVKAKDYFVKKPPQGISFAPFSIYYRLAWLQHNFKHNDNDAVKTLSSGISAIGNEKTKYDGNHSDISEDDKKEMLALYQKLLGDMKAMKAVLRPPEN